MVKSFAYEQLLLRMVGALMHSVAEPLAGPHDEHEDCEQYERSNKANLIPSSSATGLVALQQHRQADGRTFQQISGGRRLFQLDR